MANAQVIQKSAAGKPEIKSINAISFAPQGVLLVGDGRGSQIFAIETGDTQKSAGQKVRIENIAKQLGGLIGTTAKGIEILDLAVNPASRKAYLAVRKQDDKTNLIFTVDADGTISEFELDDVKYARIPVSAGKSGISLITDVAWAEDRVIAAGRSSETFASKIFSIDAPLEHEAKGNVYSAETYHVSHRRWETKAPMSVVIPLKENDQTFVVGAFSCTPVVKYPLDAIQPDAKIKGRSMIELGSGNRPLDMFVYEKGGKSYVLSNTFRFHHERKPFGPQPVLDGPNSSSRCSWVMRTSTRKRPRRLKGYEPITERIQMVEAYHGVMQMDRLDENRALVIRTTESGLNLEPLPLP